MSGKSRKSAPKLSYYPPELSSPNSQYECDSGACAEGNSGNGAVIAASIVLIILLIFVVIGGIVYWNSCPSDGEEVVDMVVPSSRQKKQVTFANPNKELRECPESLLAKIMSGKQQEPLVIVFVAPWCPACNQIKPNLEKAAKQSKLAIYTLTNDGNEKSSHVINAAKTLNIDRIPTMLRVEDQKFIPYKGDQSLSSILAFANAK